MDSTSSSSTDRGVTRGLLHDVEVRRVEAERSGWQTIGDEIDPEKLHLAMRRQEHTRAVRAWTGIRASGRPSAAVRKMQTTSPMLDEMR